MKVINYFILSLFLLFTFAFSHDDDTYFSDDEALSYVTFGSLIKLRHESTGYRLHSHEVNYGGGSKQQSVTAVSQGDDVNSYWILKGPTGEDFINQGTPVQHGDKFRLQHTRTSKNLHSHKHRAPLSDGYEVSCFGENGEGDSGDDWILEIPSRSGYWRRGEPVRIKHATEGTYLASHQLSFQKPIEGQHEVKCITKKRDAYCLWKTEEGIYFEANFDEDFQ